MNIMVIGAGAIGRQRINALRQLGEDVVAIIDPVQQDEGAWHPHVSSYFEASDSENIDWLFICTPHDMTCHYINFALNYPAHFLAEKPIGRTLQEYKGVPWWIGEELKLKMNVGFNYRFLKGVNQMLQDVTNKVFGDIISVNMTLGVGDVQREEGSWRLSSEREGRGCVLDPGIHLIDLAMLISNGTLNPIKAIHWSGFWNTGIEEETHVIATDKNKTIYNIQASRVRWRTTFSVEVNGTDGYGIVEGRNKHYGNQTYIRGKRWGWMSGKSQKETEQIVVDYDGEDSFLEETKAVLYGTGSSIQPATNIDNYKCLKFISKL